jgi:hypothetical protein
MRPPRPDTYFCTYARTVYAGISADRRGLLVLARAFGFNLNRSRLPEPRLSGASTGDRPDLGVSGLLVRDAERRCISASYVDDRDTSLTRTPVQ